ncbi:TraR/DksA family transcriptional regulator [Nonomuraea guangzhouensis]|uniref:TraR/DksA family transcriptional regulator n=1 Tax=Nonomuraea guangzhouensis TaxID=1291555 RepID=A0ABW4GCF5_9ACTN|nr:TraR/DksA C4-type zinc finger protein [Nonomuraea guangzhouensis]
MTGRRTNTHLSGVQLQSLHQDLTEQLEQRRLHLDGLREQERDSNGGDGTWQELMVSVTAAERAVTELSQATDRLVAGTYGRCTHCEAGIPFERLKIRPLARTCINCQRQHEVA